MNKLIRLVKWALLSGLFLILLLAVYTYYTVESFDTVTLPENYGQVKTELFLSGESGQPLIVGLAGGEGGNGWAGPHGAKQRELLQKNGYAFLATAYFGVDGTPENLDRIAIDGVHKAVMEAAQNPLINENCIAVMGVSRGGELALLLGSYYEEYKSVIGIVPGGLVFAAITNAMTTPGFSHNGVSLPFVPVPWSATPELLLGDKRGAFEKMMLNTEAMAAAAIKVENISGPVLLISGTQDNEWPSMEMSEAIIKRLKENNFSYSKLHIPLEGGHNEHHDNFDKVISFLEQHLRSQPSCVR
jgi:pimeloyl-ACP methyl ester carboxylesterase